MPDPGKSKSDSLKKGEEKASAEACQPFSMAKAEFRLETSHEIRLER